MTTVEDRTLSGTFVGTIQFALIFVQSVLLVPIILRYWGEEKYGLFLGIFALIQLFRTLDTGHQTFVGNEFVKLYHRDTRKAYDILFSSIRVAFLLGFIELLVFIAIWLLGLHNQLVNTTDNEGAILFIGVASMLLMWCLVGSIGGVLVRAVLALGLYSKTVIWGIIIKGLEVIVLILASFTDMSLAWLLIAMAVMNFIYSIFLIHWCFKQFPDMPALFSVGSWKKGIRQFIKSLVITMINFLDQFNTNGVILIIMRFISLSIVPVFTTIRTITNTVVQVTGLILNPLQPELIRYHSERAGDKIKSVIQANWMLSSLLVNLPLVLVTPFIEDIYKFWTNNLLDFNHNLFYCLCLTVAMTNFGKSLTLYLLGINDLGSMLVMSIVRSLTIVGVSAALIDSMGILAVGIGLMIGEMLSSVVIPIRRITHTLRSLQTSRPLQGVGLAVLPIVVLSIAFILDFTTEIQQLVVALGGAVCMIAISVVQWFRLNSEVRQRLISLPLRIKRAMN